MPEKTLRAFADHGTVRGAMDEDGGDAEAMLRTLVHAGIDLDALATRLQQEGAASFVKSWKHLLQRIADKTQALAGATTEQQASMDTTTLLREVR